MVATMFFILSSDDRASSRCSTSSWMFTSFSIMNSRRPSRILYCRFRAMLPRMVPDGVG
jgi:hypothetical protein